MVVLVTCKNDEDPFKNENTRVLTTFLPLFFFSNVKGQLYLLLPNFEPMQAFIAVLVTGKKKEDPIKNGRARVLTRFSPL